MSILSHYDSHIFCMYAPASWVCVLYLSNATFLVSFALTLLASICLEPTPDIQTNLDSTLDGQARMPALGIARPIAAHIFPEHGVPRNGLENDAVLETRLF